MAKRLKKALSLLLALSMVMSMLSLNAFAAEPHVHEEDAEAVDSMIAAGEQAERKEAESTELTKTGLTLDSSLIEPQAAAKPSGFTVKVNYNANYPDGTTKVISSQSATGKSGQTATVTLAFPECSYEGYELVRWTTTKTTSGNSSDYAYQEGETVSSTSAKTVNLYARWEKSIADGEAAALVEANDASRNYDTLQSALDAAYNGHYYEKVSDWKVTLLSDVNESVNVRALIAIKNSGTAFNMTLDLNGHTITGTGGAVITFSPLGSAGVTPCNLTITGNGTVTGGTDSAVLVSGNNGRASLTIDNGVFTGNSATNGGAISASLQDNVPVVINGGTFTGNTATGKGGAVYARTLTVNGGAFTDNSADMGGALYVVGASWTADLTVAGGQVYGNTAATCGDDIVFGLSGTGKRSTTLSLADASAMGIEGVDAWLVDGYNLTAACDRVSGTNRITFTEVQWPNTDKTGPAIIALKAGVEHIWGGEERVVVTEATFDAPGAYKIVKRCSACDEELVIETGEIPQLVAVASIGEQKFQSVGEAVAAAQTGDTIVLLVNTTENVTIPGKVLTLDLNGKTLSTDKGTAITINGSASNVTITGNGAAAAKGTGIAVNGGTLQVESGTVSGLYGIIAKGSTFSKISVNLNGGKIQGTYTGVDAGSYVTLTVDGAEIYGTDAVNLSKQSSTGGQLTLTSGTVTGSSYGLRLSGSGSAAVVNGGIISAAEAIGSTSAIEVNSGTALTVNDGTVIGPAKGYAVSNHGTAIINGGTFSGLNVVLQGASGKTATTINNGYFNGNIYGDAAKVPVSGGHFTVDVTEYVIDGYHCFTCTCDNVEGYTYEVGKRVADEPVVENRIDPTCTEDGSYDEVIYCKECGSELSRVPQTIDALGHKEIYVSNENGTHSLVCSVCNEVLEENMAHSYDENGECVCGAVYVPAPIVPEITVPGTPTTPEDPETPENPENPDDPGEEITDPENPPLSGAPVETIFADLHTGAWYISAVQFVYDNGMMEGIGGGSFAPDANTTRGMIAAILHRMENKPDAADNNFDDVLADKYYTEAVNWAAEQGIVKGYGNGNFGPEDSITREQFVAIMYRYSQLRGYDVSARADLSGFTDADNISGYAVEAMSWANAVGLIRGTSTTTLSPDAMATRAQIAAILMRFSQNVAPKADDTV